MKNPQTIFHKDGVWITDKENALEMIQFVKLRLRNADDALHQFGMRGMGQLPDRREYQNLCIRLDQLIQALDDYQIEFENMDIRDGIPDPRETSLPIPEIAE